MKYYFFIISLLFSNLSFAQNNNQNIRGVITDKLSQSHIVGANVQIVSEKLGTQTDVNGQYVLSNIAPNRYEIKISFLGYKDVVIPNVQVTSGKEVILDITMEEDLRLLKEVVIKSRPNRLLISIRSIIFFIIFRFTFLRGFFVLIC
jgi:hypothetical protein